MEIAQAEYEKKRHIFDFYRWINQVLFDLQDQPNFEEIYFERKGIVKKLLEEAIPIAHLGLFFCKPWREVFVQCLTGNQPFDGKLEFRDPKSEQTIKVEVSTTETKQSSMQRQALSRNGFVYFTGPIRRQGRQITSEAEMIDVETENLELINLTFNRYISKIEHGYDEKTAILLFVSHYSPIPLESRIKLLEKIKNHIKKNKPPIYGVYIYYSAAPGIDGFQISWPEFIIST